LPAGEALSQDSNGCIVVALRASIIYIHRYDMNAENTALH
jgi:hypothetical protein